MIYSLFLFCSFSDSQPPSTIVDQSDVISQLAMPILSLPLSDLDILISSQPGLLKFVLNNVQGLSEDIKKKLLGMEDSSAVLRMFWIVKLNPERLSNFTEEEWTPILEKPNVLFPLAVWFKTPAVNQEVKSFTNLDRVVQYIHMYRKILFAARDKIPTCLKEGGSTVLKEGGSTGLKEGGSTGLKEGGSVGEPT